MDELQTIQYTANTYLTHVRFEKTYRRSNKKPCVYEIVSSPHLVVWLVVRFNLDFYAIYTLHTQTNANTQRESVCDNGMEMW